MQKLTRQQREIFGFVKGFLLVHQHAPDEIDVLKAFKTRNRQVLLHDLALLERRAKLQTMALPDIDFKMITIHPNANGEPIMKGLTQRQEDILRFISDYITDKCYPPTYQEIADNFKIASKHGVVRHLDALEKKGKLARDGTTARGLRILDENFLPRTDSSDIVNLPLIGQVAAGSPMLAEQNIEEHVIVPRSMIRSEAKHFVLRVQGESMINAGINHGDLVIVRSTNTAEPNQIVVALLQDKEYEATVKRLIVRGKERYLKAENPDIPDIYPPNEWSIQGRVVGLIRDMN